MIWQSRADPGVITSWIEPRILPPMPKGVRVVVGDEIGEFVDAVWPQFERCPTPRPPQGRD